jgi:hypothetical protein
VGVDAGETRAVVGASLLVGVTALAVWLAGGVRVDEIARYVGYELGFVFLPGVLVYRAVAARPVGRLRQIVFGWSLGYLLEIVAFYVTASTNGRSAFYVYPIVVGVPALLIAWRRRPEAAPAAAAQPLPVKAIWIGAALIALLLLYAGAVGFTQTPLPRDASTVTYQEDTVFVISLAAEALHHWPMSNPTVSGVQLHYHLFAFMHLAAIAQVTGIDLSVVVMRLYEVPLLILFALQLFLAGRKLGRSATAGLAALFVVLFLGELDISVATDINRFLFRDLFFYWLLASHTFLLGLVFFLPGMVVLCDLLGGGRVAGRRRVAEWLLLLAFMVGCAGSKSYSLLVVGGALVLFLVWHLGRRRTVSRPALGALAVVGAVYVAANVLVFAWNAAGAEVKPFRNLKTMPGVEELNAFFGNLWGTTSVPGVFAVSYGLWGLLGISLVGMALLIWYRRLDLSESEVFFLALFVAVLPTLFFSSQPGFGQMFLVFFGVVPGMIAAAEGYRLYWLRSARPSLRGAVAVTVAVAAAVLVADLLLKVSARVGLEVALFWVALSVAAALVAGAFSRRLLVPVGLAVAICGLVLVETPAVRLVRSALGKDSYSSIGNAAQVAALALGVVAIAAGAVWLGRRRGAGGALVAGTVAATLVFGVLDTPLDWFPKLVGDAAAGKPLANQDYAGLTSGLYGGLRWIRDNTRPGDVLVVNNHSLYPDGHDSKYFYYSAFAERRVVLESWDYTEQTVNKGYFSLPVSQSPFPRRLALSDAAFQHADPDAIKTLERRYGARYLVADKVHGRVSPVLATREQLVFSNGDVDVYAIGRRPSASAFCTSEQGAGVSAVFGHGRTVEAAAALRRRAAKVGYRNLEIQRRGCSDFAVVLSGLSGVAQGRQLQHDAAAVDLRVTLECRTYAPRGGVNAVFGHRRSKAAAEKLLAGAEAVGFRGLDVQQDRCGDWEVDLAGLKTAAQRREFQREARRVGFAVRFEPG